MEALEVISKGVHAYGVRNESGFVALMTLPFHYTDQDDRFKKEKAEINSYAKLFAAAPKLLDACKEAEHLITNHKEGNHRAFIECQNDLQAVIAAATE